MPLNTINEPTKHDFPAKINTSEEDAKFRLKTGMFLTGVTGISALFGFGATLAAAKNKDPNYFNRGMAGSREMAETGASLAMRALGWGTLYAVTGCGILFYGIWKLLDVKDLKEFRIKMGTMLPTIPKNDPPQGRTEFENLSDLLRYVSEGDKPSTGK
ncbi:hypothetical protein B566_EDAN009433 [Ephemera danica]|nr:hypothetical protein B566_EDAN009433 [Ephemera danica]